MHVFTDRRIAIRFSNKLVSSRERLHYLLFSLVVLSLLFSFTTSFIFFDGILHEITIWDHAIDAFHVLATLTGVRYCYWTNSCGDGEEFIERFVCISVPVGVKTCALMFVAYLAVEIVLVPPIPTSSSVWDLAIAVAASLYFYLRLGRSIKIAAGGSTQGT